MRGRRPNLRLVDSDPAGSNSQRSPRRRRRKSVPKPPVHLPATAKKIWRKQLPDRWRNGHITQAELPSFACYCTAYATAIEARKQFEKEGCQLIVEATKGTKRNPLLQIERDAHMVIARYADQLGLTSTTRSRIWVDEPKTYEPGDEYFETPVDVKRR